MAAILDVMNRPDLTARQAAELFVDHYFTKTRKLRDVQAVPGAALGCTFKLVDGRATYECIWHDGRGFIVTCKD